LFTSTAARAPVTESIETRTANHRWHRRQCTRKKVYDDRRTAPHHAEETSADRPWRVVGQGVRETRRLADDLVLGYLSVDFAFTDRPVLTVCLSVIVRRTGEGWFISHYQVSRLA
jgi:hypothetical protein